MTPITLVLVIIVPVLFVWAGLTMIEESVIQDANTALSINGFIFFGTITGILYFLLSEMQSADNNRSYLANPITDVLAFVGSSWVIVRGSQLEEGVFVFLGATIWTIHLFQLLFKNGWTDDKMKIEMF